MTILVARLLGSCFSLRCREFVDPWQRWSQRIAHNGAMLYVTSDEEYLASVGAKTRNMVRKCERRSYTFEVFDYNTRLDDIYRVNTSMPVRQGQPMTRSYVERPAPIELISDYCLAHDKVWIGGFKDGTLYAYCQLVLCGEIAIINRIIGHSDALPDGVMNGLVRAINRHCNDLILAYKAFPRYVNYLTMDCRPSLASFKRHAGFRPMEVLCK